jgi:Putative Na+/H+ antiporter
MDGALRGPSLAHARDLATFFVVLSLVPLGGSFITEPAAMTLAAILLRDGYFRSSERVGFKYLTLGVLFVNIFIGGVLTSYAAPPVLMVASTFGWETSFMMLHFGWRAALAVLLNAAILTLVCRRALLEGSIGTGRGVNAEERKPEAPPVPPFCYRGAFALLGRGDLDRSSSSDLYGFAYAVHRFYRSL